MCNTYSSFDQLGNFMKDMVRVEMSLFETLSSNRTSDADKKRALQELDNKVSIALSTVEAKDFVFGTEDKSHYVDYCRNLAAFLIAAPKDEKIVRVFMALEELLENMAPTFKQDLRSTKKLMKNNGVIVHLGFTWLDLKLPFFADKFATAFCRTVIEENVVPTVVYVEKEVVKEVVKEVIVEKEKVVEKIVEVEAKPKEDPDLFDDEDHHTELKSSFIEKPRNARYDNQKIEVCRKICGFLNAEGGTLYIGVDPTTKKAYPKRIGKEMYGVEKDIFFYLRTTTIYHAPINDMESYCRFVKKEIHRIFESSNPETISLFINQCIRVERSKNDNVAQITVLPSQYCVVYLNGKAYQRSGEECKEMNNDEILVRRQNLKNIADEVRFYDKLVEAKTQKRQAILYGYASANSKTVSDRRVEPYGFVCNGESVLCYDMDKKAIRQFKLSRIGGIRILKDEWKYEDKHVAAKTDVFDWTDMGTSYHICLDMGLRAMITFCDTYANASKDRFEQVANGVWRLKEIVYSLEPVRAFYLSMADEIEIQETEDSELLKKAIKDFVLEHVL